MIRFLLFSAWSFTLVALYGDISWAATLYSQIAPAEPTTAFASSEFSPTSQKIGDNFSIDAPNDVAIRSLRFIGSSGLGDAVQDDFRVLFFEDDTGLPGPPVPGGDYVVGQAFSRKPTGGELLNGILPPFEYAINLPQVLNLSPNTLYWLTIVNRPSPDSGWVWARADGAFDSQLASTQGDIVTGPWVHGSSSGGMWFELSDQVVPEPSSLLIVWTGLATITIFRRRT